MPDRSDNKNQHPWPVTVTHAPPLSKRRNKPVTPNEAEWEENKNHQNSKATAFDAQTVAMLDRLCFLQQHDMCSSIFRCWLGNDLSAVGIGMSLRSRCRRGFWRKASTEEREREREREREKERKKERKKEGKKERKKDQGPPSRQSWAAAWPGQGRQLGDPPKAQATRHSDSGLRRHTGSEHGGCSMRSRLRVRLRVMAVGLRRRRHRKFKLLHDVSTLQFPEESQLGQL